MKRKHRLFLLAFLLVVALLFQVSHPMSHVLHLSAEASSLANIVESSETAESSADVSTAVSALTEEILPPESVLEASSMGGLADDTSTEVITDISETISQEPTTDVETSESEVDETSSETNATSESSSEDKSVDASTVEPTDSSDGNEVTTEDSSSEETAESTSKSSTETSDETEEASKSKQKAVEVASAPINESSIFLFGTTYVTVTVDAPSGAFPENTAVVVEQVDPSLIFPLLPTIPGLTADYVFALDVSFVYEGDLILPAPEHVVTLTYTDLPLNPVQTLKAFHVNTENSLAIEKPLQVGETDVVLTATQFSVYALTMVPREQGAMYLNGAVGNDANDGLTPETPVKTFERAKALATENQAIETIYVTGQTTIAGDVSLAGTNAIVMRGTTYNGYLFRVAPGTVATLSNIHIDGNFINNTTATNSLVYNQGTLNVTDGAVLQGNRIWNPTLRTFGGAIRSQSGIVNITGGVINNNSATSGGGIYANKSTVNMSSGAITWNEALNGPEMSAYNDSGSGGGILLDDGGEVNISGDALIQYNFAQEVGGGIAIGSLEVSFGSNTLNMTGGTIDNNSSGATGGGIFIQAGFSSHKQIGVITGGYITNNYMLGTGVTPHNFGGGGIYVNGYAPGYNFTNGELFLKNAIIANNTAQSEGGGYAACPVSETHIYVTDGVAIYENISNSDQAADVYILSSYDFEAHSGDPIYRVSDRMLGGSPYYWKYDDGTDVPLDKLEGVLTNWQDLSLHTDESGAESAVPLSSVFITGNWSATRGGGIGTNGTVHMGTP